MGSTEESKAVSGENSENKIKEDREAKEEVAGIDEGDGDGKMEEETKEKVEEKVKDD